MVSFFRKQLTPLTFELVCLFVSNQADAADVEIFEDRVYVSLHRIKWQVSHICREWGLWWQFLLLPEGTGAPTASTTSTGTNRAQTESIMGSRNKPIVVRVLGQVWGT